MRVTFLTQWFGPEPGAIRGLPLARREALVAHCLAFYLREMSVDVGANAMAEVFASVA